MLPQKEAPMTSEERKRMKWLCLLIHEEEDEYTLNELVDELEELLETRREVALVCEA
jgi:hypothetical protein